MAESVASDEAQVSVVRSPDADAIGHSELAFLARAGEVLASSLDYDTTLSNVAEIAVPFLADWVAVDLLEDDGTLRRIAVAHADPGKVKEAERFRAAAPDPLSESPVALALRHGKPLLFADIDERWVQATKRDDAHAGLLSDVGFVSEMVVPLVARHRTLGALSLATAESLRRYGPEQLLLAEQLASRAALAVDHARMHREAREAEQRFRCLVESLDAIVWELDPETLAPRFVSRRAREILGFPVARWLAEPELWWRVVHPEDRQRVREHVDAALRERRRVDVEYRVIAADGRIVWLRDNSEPVRAPNGRLLRIRGLITDITERKRVDDELRFSHALLRAQNEASVYGILIVSPDGRMLEFNQRFVDLWGIPRDVVTARSDDRALASVLDKLVDPQGFLERVRQLYDERAGPVHDELHLRDGRVFDRYGVPLVDDEGVYRGYAWYFHDSTERKQAERELKRSGERFERLARTLQQSLLPPHLPHPPGIGLAARYLPAGEGLEVGGDFYDVFRTGSHTWGLVVGDVCGKGAEAASLTALARFTVRAAAMQARRPSRVLDLLNAVVLAEDQPERFVTAAYAFLRQRGGEVRVRFAAGGHPLPVLVAADGTTQHVGKAGSLLGILPNVTLSDSEVLLRPRDALVFVTDGVLDARDATGREFGSTRLARILAERAGADAEQLAEAVETAVRAHQDGPLRDDTAVVIVRADEDEG